MKITRRLLEDLNTSQEDLERFDRLGGDGELRDLIENGYYGDFYFFNWILSKVFNSDESKKFSIYNIKKGLCIFNSLYPQEDCLDIVLDRINNDSFKYDNVYFSFTKILNQVNNDVVQNINKAWEVNQSLNLEDFQWNTVVNKYLSAANICLAVEMLISSNFFKMTESPDSYLRIIFKYMSNAFDYYITVYNNYWNKFESVAGSASDLKKEILLYGCKLIEERV